MKATALGKITYALLVVGGLNWALIGFCNYNFIGKIFSADVARIIYSIVGTAGLYGLYQIARMRSAGKKGQT